MTEEYLISEIDQLKLEISELKLSLGIASAFPVKVSMQCRKMIDSKLSSLEFLSVLCDSANRAISESSCDQLAGIKADTVLGVANDWIIGKDADYNIRRKLVAISNNIRANNEAL